MSEESRLPARADRSDWFGPASPIVFTVVLFLNVVPVMLIPYLLGPLMILYLAELVIGAALAAVSGTARYIATGMLTALGATIGRFFIPLLIAWLV